MTLPIPELQMNNQSLHVHVYTSHPVPTGLGWGSYAVPVWSPSPPVPSVLAGCWHLHSPGDRGSAPLSVVRGNTGGAAAAAHGPTGADDGFLSPEQTSMCPELPHIAHSLYPVLTSPLPPLLSPLPPLSLPSPSPLPPLLSPLPPLSLPCRGSLSIAG